MPANESNRIKTIWDGYDSSHDKDRTIYFERQRMSMIIVGEELSEGTKKMTNLDTRLTKVEKKINNAGVSVSTTKKLLIFIAEVIGVAGVMAPVMIAIIKFALK